MQETRENASEMEVARVLHMNGGMEETSYAMNSLLQRKVINRSQPIIEQTVTTLLSDSRLSGGKLVIADLGCASGPNTLFFVSELIKVVDKVSKKLGQITPNEFQIFLNDLPENDFNNIFRSLQGVTEKIKQEMGASESDLLIFFNGVPATCYGRLFPADSVHFVHSSYSLHWLSQVPRNLEKNRRNIHIGRTSPPSVQKSYYTQFQLDFSLFLRCRAHELVQGGQITFTLLGRKSEGPSSIPYFHIWELLSMVLNQMSSEGLIDQEKLDAFNVPSYMPSPLEVEAEVQNQGSFTIERLKVWESSWNPYDGEVNLSKSLQDGGHNVAKSIRAVIEPLIVCHFGLQQKIMDEIFMRYSAILSNWMAKEKANYVNITVSLTKH